jgi:DNA segregation ATPase FtsK/SpoIIIE, S-DNA-T family
MRRSLLGFNDEILGIAAFGFALLLTIALLLPTHSGQLGAFVARMLHVLFGATAWLFPLLIAVIGMIIFIEIDIPRLMATLGFASCSYFLIVVTVFGPAGGMCGAALRHGLTFLVGGVGAVLTLIVAALVTTIVITDVSLKRVIGWCILTYRQWQEACGELVPLPVSAKKPALPILTPAAGSPVPTTAGRAARKMVQGHEEPEDAEADEEYDEDDADVEDEDTEEEVEGDEDEEGEENDEEGEDDEGEDKALSTVAPIHAYRLPDLSLFDLPQTQKYDETSRASLLEDTLASFGVAAKVVHIERGPSITRYELKPDRGVKISRISALADDLALALAATSVRIEAPIPGKSAVGIEVPNAQVSVVAISEILGFLPHRGTVPPLNMALGKDITGRPVFGDLGRMPHLLVAGATGSGKSVCLNGIIASLLVSATPDQVQLLMIDPKRVELTVYNGIPHLIKDVITDARMAAGALYEMTREMDVRYERFAKAGVRKIEEYNAKFPDEKLPYVVIVIDELADLMMVAPAKVETTICRLAQLARATGIHLIVATQRPSVDVITGIIKANIPSRIAFAVSSQVDSRTILDMVGAERLLGRGDMLFLPIDAPKPVRSQGALITGAEVNRLVEFWAAQARPDNLLDVHVKPIDEDDKQRIVDALCYDAAKFIMESNVASTAQLQSQFSIGHPRAVRIMKQLEEFGIVGPHEGTKPRRINIGPSELETIAGRLGREKNAQADLFTSSPPA